VRGNIPGVVIRRPAGCSIFSSGNSRRRSRAGSLPLRMRSYAESCKERDIYVGAGSPRRIWPTRRCSSEEIAGCWCLCRYRSASDAHSKATLPATIDQALSILRPSCPLPLSSLRERCSCMVAIQRTVTSLKTTKTASAQPSRASVEHR